jgi:CDP-diacylglycerol--glycerol-3-phosphate 3-phosphatidyltransferase
VTSIRLVVAGRSGIVVAASPLGKIKTASQMIGTAVILLEPAVPVLNEYFIFTYVAMAVMTFTTIISGIDYLKAYMPYVDHNR